MLVLVTVAKSFRTMSCLQDGEDPAAGHLGLDAV